MSDLKITRATNKPIEIRLRRTGVSPPALVPDLMPGQQLLTGAKSEHYDLGEHQSPVPRFYLDLDSKGRVTARFDWYGRDGDLDGTVQDGSPFERRSRALGHLRYTRNTKKRRALELLRLRDMPFPFEPATPSSSSVEAQPAKQAALLDLHAKAREHNAAMRQAEAPSWSMTNPATLATVAMRAGEKDAQERIELFLGVLAQGRPSDRTYVGDNDLLKKYHPWRVTGMSEALLMKHFVRPLERSDLRYANLHGTLFKAVDKPGLASISGDGPIGGGRRLNLDGPGIRSAITQGAVVDSRGKLRCPPLTPGAMQFTNWKLEGCESIVKKSGIRTITLNAGQVEDFQNFGGTQVSAAEIGNHRSEVGNQTIGATVNVRKKKAVVKRLFKPVSKDDNTTTLGALIEKTKKGSVRINLAEDADAVQGIAIPRSEMGLRLLTADVIDEVENGIATEDGQARIVEWLNTAMSGPPRPGAVGSIATMTRVKAPSKPRDAEQPPLSGRAQELADQANGSFARFMELLNNEEVIIFDFETTGLGDDGNQPVEVAALRVRNGKVTKKLHLYMDPKTPLGRWSRKKLQDDAGNPLTDEWLAGQLPVGDQMKALADFMGDSIIIAHNAPFDVAILEEGFQKNNIDFKPAGVLDTLVLSRRVIPKEEVPQGSYALDKLATHFDVDMQQWHTAWSDTQALVGIVKGLTEFGQKRDVDPSILDGAVQAERYVADVEKYNAEMVKHRADMAAFEGRWGTDKDFMRMDIHDVFDEEHDGTDERRQKAIDAVVDMASQEGEPSVLRLSDSLAIDVAEVMAQPIQSTASTISPARARMHDAETRLKAAFSQLEGVDNMNLDTFTPKQMTAMMTEWKKVPGFDWIDPENPDHLWLAVDQGASNLLQLVESSTPEQRAVWRRWYEAANQYSADLGEQHGVSTATAAGVLAVLSPTQDWNGNIALGDHMMALLNDKDFTVSNELAQVISDDLKVAHKKRQKTLTDSIAKKEGKLSESRTKLLELTTTNAPPAALAKVRKDIDKIEKDLAKDRLDFDTPPIEASQISGKKLAQLDESTAARAVRFHAQLFGSEYMGQPTVKDSKGKDKTGLRKYSMAVDADASFVLGNADDMATVQTTTQYMKAIAIFSADKNRKPDLAMIDKKLGKGSKVRSFYNNILLPNDTKYADVTADTHHFGAATLVPVSASHKVLDAIFKSSNVSGVSGAYPLVRAMTVLAASRWNAEHDDDILPRALQSIAWEKIRQTVPVQFLNAKGDMTKDSSLKSFVSDTAAQIARLTSGPTPKRSDLVGRQFALLDELSTRLQGVPRNERTAVLNAWRLENNLPRLTAKYRLVKEAKTKNGKKYEVDRETGELIEIFDEPVPKKKKK